jgi:hypothetical protein
MKKHPSKTMGGGENNVQDQSEHEKATIKNSGKYKKSGSEFLFVITCQKVW